MRTKQNARRLLMEQQHPPAAGWGAGQQQHCREAGIPRCSLERLGILGRISLHDLTLPRQKPSSKDSSTSEVYKSSFYCRCMVLRGKKKKPTHTTTPAAD